MQTDTNDHMQVEMATQPKQFVNTLDPDVQNLILGWVVPFLVDDFLNWHHELKIGRQMQPAETDPTQSIGADGSRKGLQR